MDQKKYFIDKTGIFRYDRGYYDDIEKNFYVDFSKPEAEWKAGLNNLLYVVDREAREDSMRKLREQFGMLRQILGVG